MQSPAEETVEVPLAALVAMFICLRTADHPDADERMRRAEMAVFALPLTVRQRITIAAAEKLRANLGRERPLSS